MRLSGQQYVDIYATKAKEQLRRPRAAGKRSDDSAQAARSA